MTSRATGAKPEPEWMAGSELPSTLHRTNAVVHAVMGRSCGYGAGMAFGNLKLRDLGLGRPVSPLRILPRRF